MRDRHRVEQEVTRAYFDAEAAVAAAATERDRRLAEMARELGVSTTATVTGLQPAEVRKARSAHPPQQAAEDDDGSAVTPGSVDENVSEEDPPGVQTEDQTVVPRGGEVPPGATLQETAVGPAGPVKLGEWG
ncbi:hypothetical protein [Parafrankia irregularis]|uniref:hypothetical protein n=1 Tax=Parafrankia irregularis TaxID=795642 RepID=UPI0013F4FAEC|nr:hypothetical protein [Parafrankia irregularis]